MRHPAHHRNNRTDLAAVASIVLAVVWLTGCGGEKMPAEAREFCSALKTVEELEVDATTVDAFADALVQVNAVAPADVADDTAALVSFIERSTAIGELPAEEQSAAIEDLAGQQSDFDAAVAGVEGYARENCPDLQESFFGP